MADHAIHPLAELFPAMGRAELAALAENIARYGLNEPIWLHPDGRILDGRNRALACRMVGIEPRTRTWNGEGSALAFVLALNLRRRHLKPAARAMAAAKLATFGVGRPAEMASAEAISQREAARLFSVSRSALQRARHLRDHAAPNVVAMVEQGDVDLRTALRAIGRAPQVEQARWTAAELCAAVRRPRGQGTLPTPKTIALDAIAAIAAIARLKAEPAKLFDRFTTAEREAMGADLAKAVGWLQELRQCWNAAWCRRHYYGEG